MNNISESLNSTMLKARDKSIITMCEQSRNYLMNRVVMNLTKIRDMHCQNRDMGCNSV